VRTAVVAGGRAARRHNGESSAAATPHCVDRERERERERERSVSERGRGCVVCANAEEEMGGVSEGKRSEAGRRGRAFGESLS
jgi:hypothetical protein